MAKNQLVNVEYSGIPVLFTEDAWFNATSIADRFGKNPYEWLRLPATIEYLAALNEDGGDSNAGYARIWVKTKRGKNGGTWLHPDLVVLFARWLDVRFAIWCDRQIKSILKGQHPHYDWKKLRSASASSNKIVNAMLEMVRKGQGKETKDYHYANEAKLVNFALKGEFKSLERDSLSDDDLKSLAKLETQNTILIGAGFKYDDRKKALILYSASIRPDYIAMN